MIKKFSFGGLEENEVSLAASEGGLEPSDTDASAEPDPTGIDFQSEADAEMAAML